MLTNPTGDEDRRRRALMALRTPDEIRDNVPQKFVRLASQASGIPGSLFSFLMMNNSICRQKFSEVLFLNQANKNLRFPIKVD